MMVAKTFQVRCMTRILDLIVKDGFLEIGYLMDSVQKAF